jgi:hypothetical protein
MFFLTLLEFDESLERGLFVPSSAPLFALLSSPHSSSKYRGTILILQNLTLSYSFYVVSDTIIPLSLVGKC